jgi:threonine/homoserine/homoserine lactone efflux protein
VELVTFISFVVVSLGVIVSPGPNILLVISSSLSHGKQVGFQTTAGITTAMAIQLMIAAMGTNWLIGALAEGFQLLKWAGVIYLVYIGVNYLKAAFSEPSRWKAPGALGSFNRGFWVSLTNPKTILFFSAFLPQFVSPDTSYTRQIFLLSATFWSMGILVNIFYTLLASRVATVFRSTRFVRIQNGATGLLFIAASAVLAVSHQV